MRLFVLTIIAFFLTPLPNIFCESIVLFSGETVEGKIVEETNEYIRIMDSAGFIQKYSISEIKDIPQPQPKESISESKEQTSLSLPDASDATDNAMADLQKNLRRTELMIQDTLRRLYKLPEDSSKTTYEGNKGGGQLEDERDRKYKGHKKYY